MLRVENILEEIERLPLGDKFIILNKTLKSIENNQNKDLEIAANILFEDYSSDTKLTEFTSLDLENFYESK